MLNDNKVLRILVVDDEFMVAALLEDILLEQGCEVVGPLGASAPAITLIESGTPIDGAFLDINLNGDFGYPVADALSARGVPFTFLTGYASIGIDPRYASFPSIGKPFNVDTIEKQVKYFQMRRHG